MNSVSIEAIADMDVRTLDRLVDASVAEGFDFVRRLVGDWTSGANRFAAPAETLLIARQDGSAIGVCGLNVDAYGSSDRVGRLRHLYVLADHRRMGIGRALVTRVVAEAAKSFNTLTLRTNSPQAAAFYAALGFTPTNRFPSSTHVLDLRISNLSSGRAPAGT
jgi:GNAT superfamily N-acetyltransferase